MRFLLSIAAAIASFVMLAAFVVFGAATPALAGHISDVDHPDVPNCVMFPKSGANAPNCENLTLQAIYPNNGTGHKVCYVDPVTLVKGCRNEW